MSGEDADKYNYLGDSMDQDTQAALKAIGKTDPELAEKLSRAVLEEADSIVSTSHTVLNWYVPSELETRGKKSLKEWNAAKAPYIQKVKDLLIPCEDEEEEAERQAAKLKLAQLIAAAWKWVNFRDMNLPRFRNKKIIMVTGLVPEDRAAKEAPIIKSFAPYQSRKGNQRGAPDSPQVQARLHAESPDTIWWHAYLLFNLTAPELAEAEELREKLGDNFKESMAVYPRCGISQPATFTADDGREISVGWRLTASCNARKDLGMVCIVPKKKKRYEGGKPVAGVNIHPREVLQCLPRIGTVVSEQRTVPNPLMAAIDKSGGKIPPHINSEATPYSNFEAGTPVLMFLAASNRSCNGNPSDRDAPSHVGSRLRVVAIARNGTASSADTMESNMEAMQGFEDHEEEEEEEVQDAGAGEGGEAEEETEAPAVEPEVVAEPEPETEAPEPEPEEVEAEAAEEEEDAVVTETPMQDLPVLGGEEEEGEDDDASVVAEPDKEPSPSPSPSPEPKKKKGDKVGKKRKKREPTPPPSPSSSSGSGSGSESESESEPSPPPPKRSKGSRRGARR